MFEMIGKHNSATIYAKEIDEATTNQINDLLNNELSAKENIKKIVVMPDTHAGAGNVIGLTMKYNTFNLDNMKIAPELIGPDIGCGVLYVEFLTTKEIDLEKFHQAVLASQSESRPYKTIDAEQFGLTYDKLSVDHKFINENVATLGGGNHFIELYKLGNLKYAISIHTGSRTLGGKVYNHHMKIAKNRPSNDRLLLKQILIDDLKKQGRTNEISHELAMFDRESKNIKASEKIPFLQGNEATQYIMDNIILNGWAMLNRLFIFENIKSFYSECDSVVDVEHIDKPHNFIDTEGFKLILRKGAQKAWTKDSVLIPINMRDGMIVGKIKSVDMGSLNYSFPHGAGRKLSRTKAKQSLSLEEFKGQMQDVYSPTVGIDTLDEAPGAYKPLKEILEVVKPFLKRGYKIVKPIYNYKGEGK